MQGGWNEHPGALDFMTNHWGQSEGWTDKNHWLDGLLPRGSQPGTFQKRCRACACCGRRVASQTVENLSGKIMRARNDLQDKFWFVLGGGGMSVTCPDAILASKGLGF